MWSSEQDRQDSMLKAKILAVIFAFTSLSLLINLILTIITDPGQIPERPEWDMPEEKEDDESRKSSRALAQENQAKRSEVTSEERLGNLEQRDSVKSELS